MAGMSFQEKAIEAIRATGGRITGQRQVLLNVLAQSEEYLDAEELHQLASAQDETISLPTVYRTLHTLEHAELITPRYISSDHERKFYHVAANEETFHFTCRRCHRVISFQSDLVEQLKEQLAKELGADVYSVCMCADGLCADCRKET